MNIEIECRKNNYNDFLKFLNYFNNNYLLKYDRNNWNYYKNIKYETNSTSESYNNYLNSLFPKKPTFYKLLYVLKKEESLLYDDYERRINGQWEKKKKIDIKTDKIDNLIK